jgi:hypothetical protein
MAVGARTEFGEGSVDGGERLFGLAGSDAGMEAGEDGDAA